MVTNPSYCNKYCALVSLVHIIYLVNSRENKWQRRLKAFPDAVGTIGMFVFVFIVSVAAAIGPRSSGSSERDRLRRCCSTTSRGENPQLCVVVLVEIEDLLEDFCPL